MCKPTAGREQPNSQGCRNIWNSIRLCKTGAQIIVGLPRIKTMEKNEWAELSETKNALIRDAQECKDEANRALKNGDAIEMYKWCMRWQKSTKAAMEVAEQMAELE